MDVRRDRSAGADAVADADAAADAAAGADADGDGGYAEDFADSDDGGGKCAEALRDRDGKRTEGAPPSAASGDRDGKRASPVDAAPPASAAAPMHADYADDFDDDEADAPAATVAAALPAFVAAPLQPSAPSLSSSSSSISSSFYSSSSTSSSSAAPQWEDARAEDIKTGRQLGGGGFAVVFEGSYRGHPRVAVKMIVDPSTADAQRAAFMDELHTMAALHHEHIVRLLAACTRPPRQCFIMELCGPSLFDVLHNRVAPEVGVASPSLLSSSPPPPQLATQPPDLAQRLKWAAEVASAVAYLHSRRPGVIHRDIKSQNVVVSGPGGCSCKLTDFGLVGTRETAAGTPAYMAPELLAGRPFNKSVDVYAFGVLLWELLTLQVPFGGRRPDDIRERVIAGERPSGAAPAPSFAAAPAVPPVPAALAGLGPAVASAARLAQRCWAEKAALRPDMAAVESEMAQHAAQQTQLQRQQMQEQERRQQLRSAGGARGAGGALAMPAAAVALASSGYGGGLGLDALSVLGAGAAARGVSGPAGRAGLESRR